MNVCRWIVLVAVSVFAQGAHAASALVEFSSSMFSFTAGFTQTVYDADSVVLQESSGQVALMRPGKFRWSYEQPVKQLIVADGLTLWVYDEDIQQVTMQPQATTLGSAPIGLLSGERAIESEFSIIELGEQDGLNWFQLEPNVQDTDFNAVYIALDKVGLRAMELRDNFGQATQIKFTNFKKNAAISPDLLQFEPPQGVDIVGEAGTVGQTAQPETTEPAPAAAPETPVAEPSGPVDPLPATEEIQDPELTPEQVVEPAQTTELQEVSDETPGIAETQPVEEVTAPEITFEETFVPAE